MRRRVAAVAAASISYRSPSITMMSGRSVSSAVAVSARHCAVACAVCRGVSVGVLRGMRAATLNPSASIWCTVMPYCGMRCIFVAIMESLTSGREWSWRASGERSPHSARVPVIMQMCR